MKNMLHKTSIDPKLKSAILAGVAVLCGGAFYASFQTADKSFISLGNLPDGAAVETFLQTKAETKTLDMRENIIDLPQNLEATLKAPYRISSSIRMPDDSYRDFIITVGGGKIDVTADGFNPRDTVSLIVNDSAPNWTPMDWSGKLEMSAALPAKKEAHACVGVDNGKDTLTLCHMIKEGWVS